MIDIHCHFLPGVDDGPATMEEAVALAKAAVADGIACSIVTPHIHPGRGENDAESIHQQVAVYRAELSDKGVALEIRYAAEVRLTDYIFRQLELLQVPYLGQLEGYSLLLLEFPQGHIIPGSEQLVAWLLKQRVRPVLAHPERNKAVMRDPGLLQPFIQLGCLLQVTAGSLVGKFGDAARKVALQLLEQDRITYIATDAHNLKHRPPVLSEAFAMVSKIKGEPTARRLFRDNQAAFF